MKAGLGQLMRQAQEMQTRLQKMQEEIARLEVTGESGAGLVRVVMNGKHGVSRVTIDPGAMGEDKEFLEDLVAAAINDAVQRVQKATEEKSAGLTSGISLPPGFKLPI